MLRSILDSDTYKFSMQAAVLQRMPELYGEDPPVAYRFTNRGSQRFSRATYDAIKQAIADMARLALTEEEKSWLQTACPYFTPEYLDYLEAFRFKPDEQVSLDFIVEETTGDGVELGKLDLEIKGGWAATILYEVPVMAIISEAYFSTQETDWDYVGQLEQAKHKGLQLFEAGCVVSEFGTRRRRSYEAQDIIMRGLIAADEEVADKGKGKLLGTSNVHFAQKYNLAPIGTIAHEWIMGIAALSGYEGANGRSMDLWEKTYPSGFLSIALTDTFSTKPFFDDFVSDPERARRWKGLRQDSGSPFKFIEIAKEAFERVGADPKQKLIVFSDGLDVAKSIELKKASDEAGIGCSFGIGTTFTNDFKKVAEPVKQEVAGEGEPRGEGGESSKALNMVIKLFRINNDFCVKISDDLTKNTGDLETVRMVKHRFGLE